MVEILGYNMREDLVSCKWGGEELTQGKRQSDLVTYINSTMVKCETPIRVNASSVPVTFIGATGF